MRWASCIRNIETLIDMYDISYYVPPPYFPVQHNAERGRDKDDDAGDKPMNQNN